MKDTETIEALNQLPPLMPQFLQKRRAGLPAVGQITAELGIERAVFFVLVELERMSGSYGGAATLAQMRLYKPYATLDDYAMALAVLYDKELAAKDDKDAFSLTPRGRLALDRLYAAGRDYVVRMKPLPDDELEELARQLERAIEAVKRDPVLAARTGSRLAGAASLARPEADSRPMVRIEQAIYELWAARDDAHIKAWRDAGLDGPPMAAFTRVWAGEAQTVGDLVRSLEGLQAPADVEGDLVYLMEEGYVERSGEEVKLTPEGALVRGDVERETDRVYFASWPQTREEAEWMQGRLGRLVEGLVVQP